MLMSAGKCSTTSYFYHAKYMSGRDRGTMVALGFPNIVNFDESILYIQYIYIFITGVPFIISRSTEVLSP
jgi:hypothetical protein